jgi:hypothetical protein
MTYIKIIAFAMIFSQFAQGTKFFKRKPFTCVLCMTFWVSLLVNLNNTWNIFEAVGTASIMGLTASLIEFIYVRIIRIIA